jgi:preprotein translocase SecE subunit
MKSGQSTVTQSPLMSGIVSELKKVSWPSREETIRLTIIVLLMSLIIGAYVGIIDILLAKALELLTKAR